MQTDFCGYGGTADAPDLESGEKSCRFKSYYPHHNLLIKGHKMPLLSSFKATVLLKRFNKL